MGIQVSFNKQIIDYSKQLHLPRVTRPQMGIAIFPLNASGTTVSVSVDTTSINLRYVADSTQTEAITFVGTSVTDIVASINRSVIPVKAVALSNAISLSTSSFLPTGGYKEIPGEFTVYDRTTKDRGIILRLNQVTVKHNKLTKISILPPYSDSVSLPWYPRISIGSFSQRYKDKIFNFQITEFDYQTWSLKYGKPFVDLVGVTPIFYGPNAVKLPRAPVYWDNQNFIIYNGNLPISSSVIKDVDTSKGIIYFEEDFFINPESLTINYSYIETSYVYKGINLNAHFTQNPSLIDKFVVIYLLPVEASTALPNKNPIRHIIADSIEEAVNNIEIENPEIPIAILGAYNIQQIYSSDRASILDTRVKGGGLIENIGPTSPVHLLDPFYGDEERIKIEDHYREAGSFSDIGRYDGEVYPGAAAIVVNIPEELKDILPISDLKERALKQLSAGIYPIVEFSYRDLPGITGASTQIAAFFNEDLSSSLSGSSWILDNYNIPDETILSDWEGYSFTSNPTIYRRDNSNVFRVDSMTGVFQYYLKSTPVVGIEWEERDVYYVSGETIEYAYSDWSTKRLVDTKTVDDSSLIKRSLTFKSDSNIKEIRNVTVHAPYRVDSTGDFRGQVSDLISEITGSLSDKYSSIDSTIDYPISYYVENIVDYEISKISDYFGVHNLFNFLLDISTTDLYPNYSGMFYGVATDLTYAFSGIVPKFMSVPNSYYDIIETDTTAEYSDILYQLAGFTARTKQLFGSSDATYLSLKDSLNGFLSGVSGNSDYIAPEYVINGETITAVALELPELLGYPKSETTNNLNQDYRMLDMLPGMLATIASFTGTAEIVASPHLTLFGQIGSMLSSQRTRIPLSLGDPTYSGSDLAITYYSEYGRYSQYLGNTISNLINGYDYLYTYLTGITSTPWTRYSSSAPGYDVATLDLVFLTLETALSYGFSGVKEHIFRNGITDPGMLNVLKGYGWYVNNAQTHLSNYSASANVNTLAAYEGLYTTGTLQILKGSLTEAGGFFETKLIDSDVGPFEVDVPTLIVSTLAQGCQLNPSVFIPYTQATINTLTGLYNVSGVYWEDPHKFDNAGGKEYELIKTFSELYKAL